MKHMRRYIARTVLVTTGGGVFKGTLTHADADLLVIEHVSTVGDAHAGPLDGAVAVPVAAVTWVQVV